jgi:hypothetical protein
LKKAAGQPNSERMSTIVWKMINNRLRTAQNAPAGWLGTVLPLTQVVNVKVYSISIEGDSRDVVKVQHVRERRVRGIGRVGLDLFACNDETVDGLNIMHQSDNVASENEDKSNDAQDAHAIEADESI